MNILKISRQHTLCDSVHLEGVGVHTGLPIGMTLLPASDNTGIVFHRTDVDAPAVAATAAAVTNSDLSTVIGNPESDGVATIEHLMATLMGLGVDNCIVEIDGPEVPVMDGSAAAFVAAIDQVGLQAQKASRRHIRILKPVSVESGLARVELLPAVRGYRIESEIEFTHPLVGRQTLSFDLDPASFRREVARARTFGFLSDVERLTAMGRARGASLENTIVVAEDRILNPEGLRFGDEFVRHKALDSIGDLALLGAPVIGVLRSRRGGHRLNVALARAVLADPSNYVFEEEAQRRERGHGVNPLPVAAYRGDLS